MRTPTKGVRIKMTKNKIMRSTILMRPILNQNYFHASNVGFERTPNTGVRTPFFFLRIMRTPFSLTDGIRRRHTLFIGRC